MTGLNRQPSRVSATPRHDCTTMRRRVVYEFETKFRTPTQPARTAAAAGILCTGTSVTAERDSGSPADPYPSSQPVIVPSRTQQGRKFFHDLPAAASAAEKEEEESFDDGEREPLHNSNRKHHTVSNTS